MWFVRNIFQSLELPFQPKIGIKAAQTQGYILIFVISV